MKNNNMTVKGSTNVEVQQFDGTEYVVDERLTRKVNLGLTKMKKQCKEQANLSDKERREAIERVFSHIDRNLLGMMLPFLIFAFAEGVEATKTALARQGAQPTLSDQMWEELLRFAFDRFRGNDFIDLLKGTISKDQLPWLEKMSPIRVRFVG